MSEMKIIVSNVILHIVKSYLEELELDVEGTGDGGSVVLL